MLAMLRSREQEAGVEEPEEGVSWGFGLALFTFLENTNICAFKLRPLLINPFPCAYCIS